MALFINDIEIPESAVRFELDRLLKFYSEHMSPTEIQAQMTLLRKKACEQAIGARLMIDEANRLELPVAAEDIDQSIEAIVEKVGGEDQFEALLEKQGMTRDQLVLSIVQGRRVDMLVEDICRDIPEPTEEEMQAHFDGHRREYRKPDRVQAQHILVTPDSGSDQDRETARSRLLGIRASIEEGADFSEQAAAHSECPSGQRAGGSLGWVTPGMMVPEFDNVLFDLAVGQLSDPVETQFGFHLIYKTAEEEGGEAAFEDVKDRVREFLVHAARGEAIKRYVDELKQKAKIEER